MRHFKFKCSETDTKTILSDNVLKKLIESKTTFKDHLLLGIKCDEHIESYIMLKYGDFLLNHFVPSRKPKMFIDYYPLNVPNFIKIQNK